MIRFAPVLSKGRGTYPDRYFREIIVRSITKSWSLQWDSDNSEGKEQGCEMKWCCNIVICWKNLRITTGDNSNTQLLYRDVIIGVLHSFLASWRIFISVLICFSLSVFSRNMWARVETFTCLVCCQLFALYFIHFIWL